MWSSGKKYSEWHGQKCKERFAKHLRNEQDLHDTALQKCLVEGSSVSLAWALQIERAPDEDTNTFREWLSAELSVTDLLSGFTSMHWVLLHKGSHPMSLPRSSHVAFWLFLFV